MDTLMVALLVLKMVELMVVNLVEYLVDLMERLMVVY
jgi:hypothetical protein